MKSILNVNNHLFGEKILLFLIFPLSIVIDLTNGFLQSKGYFTPIGLTYRSFIIVLLFYKILRHPTSKLFKFLILIVFLYAVLLSYWNILAGSNSLKAIPLNYATEFNHFVRIIYFLLCIVYFYSYRNIIDVNWTLNLITNYGLIISIAIIYSFLTGNGIHSYGENYGFGSKSYFIAGNDLGLNLIFCSIISSLSFLKNLKLSSLIKYLIIILGCVFIGSRVGIFGSLIWFFVFLIYFVFFYRNFNVSLDKKRNLYICLLLPFIVYGFIKIGNVIYEQFDSYTLERMSLMGIASARSFLKSAVLHYFASFSVIDYLLGRGITNLFQQIGLFFMISDNKAVEADAYEIIGGYGIIFFLILYIPFFYFAIKSFFSYLKNRSFLNFSLCFVFSSFIFIGFNAGHAINNTMVAPVYSYFVLLLFNQINSSVADSTTVMKPNQITAT